MKAIVTFKDGSVSEEVDCFQIVDGKVFGTPKEEIWFDTNNSKPTKICGYEEVDYIIVKGGK